jgi:hypothetical protein
MDDTAQRLCYKIAAQLYAKMSTPRVSLRPRMDDTMQRLLYKIASLLPFLTIS